MYAQYFGLAQEPFSIAPDPRYLFMSERHREALAHLLYGLSGGGGFVLLTGEIGTGKTTVCRSFLEQIPPNCNVAYIFNPKLTVLELLQSVCDEFHIAVPAAAHGAARTVKEFIDPLNAFLLTEHAAGRNNVLIIDEAQNLAAEVLEQLRLLTNLETHERKLLQIILIGQPELRTLLARPQLEQLAQRVIARYHLGPLTEQETAHYVQHRLQVAGLARALPFERGALKRLHQRSRGVPRRINLLCGRALLGAFGQGRPSVTASMVDQAADEVFGLPTASSRWGRLSPLAVGVLAGLVVGGAFWAAWALWWPGGATRMGAAPVSSAAAPAAVRPAQPVLAAASASAPDAAVNNAAPTASAPASSAVAAMPTVPVAPAVLWRDENAAWAELAQAWQAQPVTGAACRELPRQALHCFERNLSLSLVRQLDRPGLLRLDAATGSPSYALLVGLSPTSATLRAAGTEQTVTLDALAARWQGDFATLWRAPDGYTGRAADGERGAVVAWAALRLAELDRQSAPAAPPRVLTASLRQRLRAFQLAQGLPVDGLLGPLTLMQLNRVAGIDEPRLQVK